MRRIATAVLTTLVGAALVVVLPAVPAMADGHTSTTCNLSTYTPHYKIMSAARSAGITHLSTHVLPPSGTRSVTRTTEFYRQLSAGVTYNSGATVSASGISKVLAKAEVAVNMELKAAGSVTNKSTLSITETISNPTGHNAQFVFYRGYTKASGAFRYYYCRQWYLPGQNYGPVYVSYHDGKWRSYNIYGEGAPRCGAGEPPGLLGRAAYRIGCAA